jgi:tetratricopeptide (TPR) repeat protein
VKLLARILVSCAVLVVSGCANIVPEKSAREWMADGRNHSALAHWDDAIADFTEVLRLEPGSREALVLRAHASYQNGDVNQALDDCEAAFRLEPHDIELHHFRAIIYLNRGEHAKAEQDEREAGRPEGLFRDGLQAVTVGDYRAAAADYESAVRLDPHNLGYRNQLAWLEAACPDEAVRNGKHAVELAHEVCGLNQWRDPDIINTLAAAYAESGQFAEAVKIQQKAVDLVGPRRREDFQRRLKMYQEQKPYRFGNRR